VYKLKQQGTRLGLIEQFAFRSRFTVTSLHIEQYVTNSRPILCLASDQSEIAIYYLDEGASEGRPPRQASLLSFNFFTRAKEGAGKEEGSSESEAYDNFSRSSKRPGSSGGIENEITSIRYVRDIGLIATALNGTVKIFDAFSFKELWSTSNKTRKSAFHLNITCMDISIPLGLLVVGGAEGQIMLVDPYAFGVINGTKAHAQEVLSVQFFDEQQQIITIGVDRTLCLWDAYRLEKL